MWWLSLLLWALTKVVEWLLTNPRLTAEQQRKLNTAIARAHRLEDRACSLGCTRGGEESGE